MSVLVKSIYRNICNSHSSHPSKPGGGWPRAASSVLVFFGGTLGFAVSAKSFVEAGFFAGSIIFLALAMVATFILVKEEWHAYCLWLHCKNARS